MLYFNLPINGYYGWGLCGKHLACEMAQLNEVGLLAEAFSIADIVDPIEYAVLRDAVQKVIERPIEKDHGVMKVNGPLLQDVGSEMLWPRCREFTGSLNIGYAFVEKNILQPEWIKNGLQCFDRMVAGSSWCARMLLEHGLKDVVAVIVTVHSLHIIEQENGHATEALPGDNHKPIL